MQEQRERRLSLNMREAELTDMSLMARMTVLRLYFTIDGKVVFYETDCRKAFYHGRFRKAQAVRIAKECSEFIHLAHNCECNAEKIFKLLTSF